MNTNNHGCVPRTVSTLQRVPISSTLLRTHPGLKHWKPQIRMRDNRNYS